MKLHQLPLLGLLPGALAFPKFNPTQHLWYKTPTPAGQWENGSLPIGNGRLAATIYGSLDDVVTINENTIWSGPLQDRTPENALAALPVARELLLDGNITEAGEFIQREMNHPVDSMRAYSYFGNLEVGFGHGEDGVEVEGYRRWLDTRVGDSGIEYTIAGVKYTREYIASYPAEVLAARFTASKKGALSLNATFSRASDITSLRASASKDTGLIELSGSSGQSTDENPILFTGQARFRAKGAKFAASDDGILSITGATTIEVFFDAETNYRYPGRGAIDGEIDRKLSNALKKGFEKVKSEALKDSSGLLSRASINLGKSSDEVRTLPTDERIAKARSGLDDPELATLTWNYGRHMLVASSRNTKEAIDLPANLQGIWNNKTTAAWGGKYTININTEMNYWPSGQTNIIETQDPLFDLFKVAHPRAQALAKDMYNCSGIVIHHNLDLWGDPAPVDNYTSSSMWPMGAAWLATHLVDHYRYSGDKKLLSETVYPYLLDISSFYQCYTFEYEGHRVTGPSVSPENTFYVPDGWTVAGKEAAMDIAIPMDDQIIWEVLSNLLEVAAELDIKDTDPDVVAARTLLNSLTPPRIGAEGQIQEWRLDYDLRALGHRHLSPLYGLHPGVQFSPLLNETLSTAAEVLLDQRNEHGSGSTGWSNAWFINQYARLYRGADAWAQIEKWFSLYPTNNLWNTDKGATFQIDGNFGVTSGITELLLQSHGGVVHVLPALPAEVVPSGSVKGLKARGGFVVDAEWEGGVLTKAIVRSERGGKLKLLVQGSENVRINGKVVKGELQTRKGSEYIVTLGK
ncbi:Six-hairpin glycosidase-like protein [Aspergillus karnatakaensis]|uniref:glycoside hydrolase family 95 protein n=1 Tax=Aspergillus karnatakaensis TaxID=1810916 RepID=UPI003CCDED16